MKIRRYSIIKEQIIRLLKHSTRPLTAVEIFQSISSYTKVNKTTIYRQLEILSQDNLINSINLIPETTHFEIAKLNHHHHFVCTQCNQVQDLECQIPNHNSIWSKEEKLLTEQGIKISQNPEIIYKGTCANCNH